MGKVIPLPTERGRQEALLCARALFTLHATQTLAMYASPWALPWWSIAGIFGYIYWLNRKHKGCPWTRMEYRLRKQGGQKVRPHALIARLLAFPVNIWKPEEKRRYPSSLVVDTVLMGSVVVIVLTAMYLQITI